MCDGFRQLHDATFARSIGRAVSKGTVALQTGDIDDAAPAALSHPRGKGLREEEGGTQMQVDLSLPRRWRDGAERFTQVDTCRIDQYVDWSEYQGLLGSFLCCSNICEIARNALYLDALCLESFGRRR